MKFIPRYKKILFWKKFIGYDIVPEEQSFFEIYNDIDEGHIVTAGLTVGPKGLSHLIILEKQ